MRSHEFRQESGLTLVEVLASLVVFSIMTLGIVPLLMGSMQGAALSRSTTIGKQAAQKALERARALPFFRSIASEATRVDILDIYYPDDAVAGAGTAYSAGKFTTSCPGAATPRACPPGMPAGYSLRFESEFIRPGAIVGGRETFTVVTPTNGYVWNAANNLDQPPTQLLRLSVTSSWSVNARPQSFTLTTIVGDRKLGQDKIRGFGRVDHTVEVLTSFRDAANLNNDLVAVVGLSDVRIETRVISAAEGFARTGEGRLVQSAVDPVPATEISHYTGATTVMQAPPDVNPGTVNQDSNDLDNFVTHVSDPTIGNVAFYDTSRTVAPLRATVAAEIPAAQAGFEVDSSGATALDQGFWVDTQALTGEASPLHFDGVKPMLYVQKKGTVAGKALAGSSLAEAGNVATDKRVQSSASTSFGRAHLFPVDFLGPAGSRDPVIQITDFSASVACKTTGTTPGFATASYSAQLQYWRETTPNDGLRAGAYVIIDLGTAKPSDPLSTLFKTPTRVQGPVANHPDSSNPMVYEHPGDVGQDGHENDVYLFSVIHEHLPGSFNVDTNSCLPGCHSHAGYLENWGSKFSNVAAGTLLNVGREATARIDGAVSITTSPTNPANSGTGLVISMGKLSCEAVDNR